MSPLVLPAAAVVAGVLSITSPCCLPLLPGYLSYIGALPADVPGRRSVAFRASLGFVGGFTVVFTALGATASMVSVLLIRNIDVLVRVAGVGVIVLGLSLAGVISVRPLLKERLPLLNRTNRHHGSGFVLGVAFAFGWTPCIGPVLATILTLSASSRSIVGGTVLLFLYSVGLGLPFVALAVGFHRLKGSLSWLQRHGRAIERVSGGLLVVIGLLYVTGEWAPLFRPMQTWFARYGWPPL